MDNQVFLGIFMMLLPPIILGILFGLPFIPANIAKKKGYGFAGFYIFGFFLFLIALIVALCLSDKNKQLDEIKKAIYSEQSKINDIGGEENV